jgi:hypothetical protein
MNLEQSKIVSTQIENLLKSDIDKKIAEFYKDQSEIEKIQISRLNIAEFISLTKRVLKQIEKEVASENRFALPFTHNVLEVGQLNLDQAISTLNSQISSNQLASAENYLFWLIQYAINNGFYDKSKYKTYPVEVLKIQEQKDRIDLLNENFQNLNESYKNLVQELNTTKSNIDSYYIKKQEELQLITENLSSSTNNNNQINDLLNLSNINYTKVSGILEHVEKEKLRIEKLNSDTNAKFEELTSLYSNTLKELQTSDTLYKGNNEKFNKRLEFVESKTDYFNERNEYLDILIGREVGASLFETFKQRKTELNKPIIFWRWAVMILGALTFIVVLGIFTNMFGLIGTLQSSYSWELIVVNFVKSTPFFFLLYYAISQYNKERNFQEEYAFKSASALTIKAYADILNENNNKDELILKAVYNVYKSPTYNSQKNSSKKDINNITDLLAQAVDKASEILKKDK